MKIGNLPLDERPVNTRYPQMLAASAGVTLVQPPADLLCNQRQPARSAAITAWLLGQAPTLDVLIVSVALLGFGGLVPSRITDEPSAAILARLDTLRTIKAAHPNLTIYGFDLVTRISRSANSREEPPYWTDYGPRLYRYSQLLDRDLQGQDVAAELVALREQLPTEHVQDFMARRLRNHLVNIAMLEMLTAGVFDGLVLSSDDTSAYGIGTREKRWLAELAARTPQSNERLLMYPGADEVGCALLARALNEQVQRTPKFAVRYALPGDEQIAAPFEDGPVKVTVERQIRAVGGLQVADSAEADFVVAVNTPSRHEPPYLVATLAEYDERRALLAPFVADIKTWVEAGQRVIICDVAYPNGADAALVDLLIEQVPLARLAAYGAWNTAGNTIGTALAQGVAANHAPADDSEAAVSRFLTHHFVEDWAYQALVRPQLFAWLAERNITAERIPAEDLPRAYAFIEEQLQAKLADLPGLGERWRIAPGSVTLPWERPFEVDFDLVPR